MVNIRYTGSHRPEGMIIDMDMDRAKDAIKSGEFEMVDGPVKEKKITTFKSIKKVRNK